MQFWRSPKQLWNCVQRSIRRQVLCKKRCSEKFCKFAGLRPATLIKKGLRHKYFPVNFVEFLRTPFPFSIEYLLWLLLRISPYSVWMWENTDQKNSEYGHFSHIPALGRAITLPNVKSTVFSASITTYGKSNIKRFPRSHKHSSMAQPMTRN